MPWEFRYFSHAMDDYTKITEWFVSIDDNFETEKRDDMYIYSPRQDVSASPRYIWAETRTL